jgi:hypothetical protein
LIFVSLDSEGRGIRSGGLYANERDRRAGPRYVRRHTDPEGAGVHNYPMVDRVALNRPETDLAELRSLMIDLSGAAIGTAARQLRIQLIRLLLHRVRPNTEGGNGTLASEPERIMIQEWFVRVYDPPGEL